MFFFNRAYAFMSLVFLVLLFLVLRNRKTILSVIRSNPRLAVFVTLLVFIAAGFLVFLVNAPGISLTKNAKEEPSASFTFFDVGENTLLTKDRIKTLDRILGQNRLENLTPVSLNFISNRWMLTHFPHLKEMDVFFRDERWIKPIATKTLKLDYRYTDRHVPPFTNVHFVFSDISKKPLFIRMRLADDGEKKLKSIEERYGIPEKIEEKRAARPVLFWRNKKDLLVFAVLPDRYGKPETRIFLVYGENLEVFRADILKEYPEPASVTDF